MTSKHTEGPWFVTADNAHDCPSHKNSGLAMVDTGRGSDWPIARLCEWNNANLIAAAPDLLKAAQLQEKADAHWANCEECEGSESPELGCEKAFGLADQARILRREAIAKARGTQ